MRGVSLSVCLLIASVALAAPPGFVKTTIPLNAPPAGLAFDAAGTLYALEGAAFGENEATLRVVQPDGTINASFTVSGEEPGSFYVGGMAYDPVNQRLLISDNAGVGRLYAVDLAGTKSILAEGITYIAGVAVRDSGKIFVSTATGGDAGEVLQIVNGVSQPVLGGLDYGAGLAFDANGDLLVQDVSYVLPTFVPNGRLQKLPISSDAGVLHFGTAELLIDNMQSSYAVVLDADGDIFTTGNGGLYQVSGNPLAEASIAPSQFSAAAALLPGTKPFQAFAGPDGGKLAYAAEAYLGIEDLFITVLTPAEPGDYNADGEVDTLDYGVWRTAYGSDSPVADGNRDGVVDSADYLLWRKHSAPGSASTTAGMSVPEPAASALIITSFLTRLCRRRRPLRHQHFVGTTPPARTR